MHGMLALVPRRSLTLTIIIGSPVGAGAGFFSFLDLSGWDSLSLTALESGGPNLSAMSRPRPNLVSTSLSRSFFLPTSRRSGDLCRGLSLSLPCSRYPLSNLLSSLLSLPSSSYLGFSFHLNPPPDFLGRSSCLRLGDRLLERSLRGGEGDFADLRGGERLLGRSSPWLEKAILRE